MSNYAIPWLIIIVKAFLILFVTLTLAAYMVLAERKLLARMQNRYGPNRVGPFGLLQPLADVIKLITKEDILPDQADKFIYFIAPGVVAGTVLLTFAVVPFGAPVTVNGTTVGMPVIDLNVGALVFPRHVLPGRLRRRARRLVVRVEVQSSGRHTRLRADDFL